MGPAFQARYPTWVAVASAPVFGAARLSPHRRRAVASRRLVGARSSCSSLPAVVGVVAALVIRAGWGGRGTPSASSSPPRSAHSLCRHRPRRRHRPRSRPWAGVDRLRRSVPGSCSRRRCPNSPSAADRWISHGRDRTRGTSCAASTPPRRAPSSVRRCSSRQVNQRSGCTRCGRVRTADRAGRGRPPACSSCRPRCVETARRRGPRGRGAAGHGLRRRGGRRHRCAGRVRRPASAHRRGPASGGSPT